MSLILEALRKSEAQRRRGLPPDVHAELPPAANPRRSHWPAWIWSIPALILGAAALMWWLQPQLRRPRPSTEVLSAPDSIPSLLPAQTPQPQVHADSPAANSPAPAPTAPSQAAEPQVHGDSPAASSPAPAPTAPSQVAGPADPASAPTGPDSSFSDRPTATPAASQPAAADAATARTTHPDPGRVLSLQDLDPDTRSALPPLRLSMHLWNEVPAQRFVIIDGQRLIEGDRVGEASIVRIERDGVLLEWQGRGLRIPVH